MGKGRGRIYRFCRGNRKVKYMETLVRGRGKEGYFGVGFWGGHKKVEYLKALVRRRGRNDI